jgi:hypothetical protein
LADALGIDFTTLDTVMGCDVVICLAPATPATTGMIGARELALLPRDAVFVNVSRAMVLISSRCSPRPNLRMRAYASSSTILGRSQSTTTDRIAQRLLVSAHLR